jgi:hypothetical protein
MAAALVGLLEMESLVLEEAVVLLTKIKRNIILINKIQQL